MARELSRLGRCTIEPSDFDPGALPDHLRMTFAAVDERGTVLGRSKSLAALRKKLAPRVEAEVSRAAAGTERPAAVVWTAETLGNLPETVTREVGGRKVTGYPALVAEKDGVAVRVLSTPQAQQNATRQGLRALLLSSAPTKAKAVTSGLTNMERLALGRNPDGSFEALIEDCRACAVDELIAAHGAPVRTPEEFEALAATVRSHLPGRVARLLKAVVPVLSHAHEVGVLLDRSNGEAADDVREQLQSLLFPGFVTDLGSRRIADLPRYLAAATQRLEALPASAHRDAAGMDVLDRVYGAYDKLLARLPEERRAAPEVVEIYWMIEELRVSLFAQGLGTRVPVSEKRVLKAIDTIR